MSGRRASTSVAAALADASPVPVWLDSRERPEQRPPLSGTVRTKLAVVGGGFTGLWSALRALERDPGASVVVLEADRVASAASGRNGGFVEASLTHGLANGLAHFPSEIGTLERLGRENLDGLESTLVREEIDCGYERTGSIDVATATWHLEVIADGATTAREHGAHVELLDGPAVRARVDSPTYLGGLAHPGSSAIVDPARLGWGLARAVESRGGVVHEGSQVTSMTGEGRSVRLATGAGTVIADEVVLATNAFPPLVRTVRRYVIPVYDYVLATEPIDAERLASIGWSGREGLSDVGNQFHYYRLTPDDRILFGGYDAIYYYGNAMGAARESRRASFELLARHFSETFPQLEGVRFTHAWGGAIDTCSRFCAFFGTAEHGRAAYAAGFTGLGVGASRFAADVLLDLVGRVPSERAALEMVRTKPFPFPPEPLRSLVVARTRRSIARADASGGRRDAWLRLLDRLGVGFDS
ncbi:MAG: FAD-dependent oxidoreductase [Actinomycetota bacterium]|nr:FAD-dependent oxidoreductase [Actinomycetota bacterium]